MLRPIAIATAISGTLDILFAMILTLAFGRHVPDMLRLVASGPFPDAVNLGTAGGILGLLFHFALMAIMATALMFLLRWKPERLETPIRTGIAFGVLTYFVMNWAVVPLRFGTPLSPKTLSIVTQAFAHIVLVGIPMTWIARGYLRQPME